jgi:V/A-type H+-transporting ATPase subunit I
MVPLKQKNLLSNLEMPWHVVFSDNKYAYTVLISKKEPDSSVLPLTRTHLGTKSKVELLDELEQTELALDDLNAKRQGLTRFIYLLSVNIAQADDKASLASASQKTFDDGQVIALQGWVPDIRLDEVTDFARSENLVCIAENPEEGEVPPTQLKQPKKMSAAKDLALFYQVPGYYGWDPSKLLFVSFSLFFAMILADAGYGLLLGAALLFSWKKLARTDKGKAYRLLGLSLTVSTILYGVLVGSYFGMSPPIGSILESINILDINDFDVMMKLSIIVGAIHLGIANISMAYVNRHKRSALAKLGWLCAIYGGLFYWLLGESENGQLFSYCLIAVGALAIVFFTSERPIVKASDHLFRLFDGIFSLKNALNAFGDVLSYMRLFALGLASASLAITFNGLASDAYYAISGGGLLIAILILLVGHALNLVLSLMSGVVHGLRLNYIEFYNWGQAEEGTAFQTFAETEVKK